jgi:hypothetical protein
MTPIEEQLINGYKNGATAMQLRLSYGEILQAALGRRPPRRPGSVRRRRPRLPRSPSGMSFRRFCSRRFQPLKFSRPMFWGPVRRRHLVAPSGPQAVLIAAVDRPRVPLHRQQPASVVAFVRPTAGNVRPARCWRLPFRPRCACGSQRTTLGGVLHPAERHLCC